MEQILNLRSGISSRIKFEDIILSAPGSAVDDEERMLMRMRMNEDGDAIWRPPCQKANHLQMDHYHSFSFHFPYNLLTTYWRVFHSYHFLSQ